MRIFFFIVLLAGVGAHAQNRALPQIGVAQNIEHHSLMAKAGFVCMVESIPRIFSPVSVTDQQFLKNLEVIEGLTIPVAAVNIFIPGDMKLVGPTVNEQAILEYVGKVFDRCNRAGIKMIVWGSGGARRVPDGVAKDEATKQFVSIAKKISQNAQRFGIVLALENLNHTETNFINTLAEALAVVQKVNQPNFRLCADIYHMLMENEEPDVILKAGNYLVHVDIAEKNGRTPPGVHQEDFTPYLAALKAIEYQGKIIMECRWENLAAQAETSYRYLSKQLMEVY